MQHYTAQLIAALARRDDVDLTVHCSPEAATRLEALTDGGATLQTNRTRPRGFDVIHWPTVYLPRYGRPIGTKVVMTFHDLVPVVMPQAHMSHYRAYFNWILPSVARWLDGIAAVSESTARDVREHYRVSPDQIVVTGQGCRYEGAEPNVGERERFILAVGTLEPRKNLKRVVEAFARLDDPTLKLKIAGGQGWGERETGPDDDRVEWLGYVENDELEDLYRRAMLLAYPSLYEGFGLPVLEAMTLGCPVLTSNVSSLPEVGGEPGEAVVQVDPEDVGAIAEAMRRIVEDPGDLSRRGLERAKVFTWERCAQRTVALYGRVLSR